MQQTILLGHSVDCLIRFIKDLTRVVILYEIYETSRGQRAISVGATEVLMYLVTKPEKSKLWFLKLGNRFDV